MDAGAVVQHLVQRGVVVCIGRWWREEVVDVDEGVDRAAKEEVCCGGVERERGDVVVVGLGVLRLNARGAEIPECFSIVGSVRRRGEWRGGVEVR